MTIEDFKYLWFRDKAFDMKEPSIDRVNTKGDYILTNCRFIELQENRWRYGRKPVLQYSLEGKFIKRHETLMRAAKETSINISLISNVAHGRKNKTAGGYKWKLAMKTGKK